ncbi:MAG TPA: transposase [Candidatus Binatia bacterium]|jgi:putative transposase
MSRAKRVTPAKCLFHVLNRANGNFKLFESERCYRQFLAIFEEARRRHQTQLLAYCLMPNHWHMLLSPQVDGDLSPFVKRFSFRAARRWHYNHGTIGRGHLYQGRFRSFVIVDDAHLITVCRYIEANPLRAGLVVRAEDWKWSSAGAHMSASEGGSPRARGALRLDALPVSLPADWRAFVNAPTSATETEGIRDAIRGERAARLRPRADEDGDQAEPMLAADDG